MARRTRTGNATLAVAYLRASTDDQHLGPEAQRAAIDAWAAANRVTVVGVFADHGVSGASPLDQRPGLLAALEALRTHGAGVLVAAKRDRVARDVVVAAMVERAVEAKGARVVSAAGEGNGDSPADAFMRTVISGAAAYELGLIRARTKAALQAKKARGERVGTVPYGFRLGADAVSLEQDGAEQAVLAEIRELSAAGLSQRAIVGALGARGFVSRTGKPFAKTQVHNALAKGAA